MGGRVQGLAGPHIPFSLNWERIGVSLLPIPVIFGSESGDNLGQQTGLRDSAVRS